MKHTHWGNTQKYIDAFNDTLHTPFWLFIIWQLVSASSIGHHQAIIQEHDCSQGQNWLPHNK
jgi:hypothetical protein